ncbi:MAG: hypothetical protein LBE82_02150 [Chitinophagaceae bacterium]|jgi:hypothetical protein|nr:hypothetical protein [Chitinophagaceae bacterium]
MPKKHDEILLKDFILKVKGWWKYLLSKWLVICITGLIGGGLGLTYAIIKKPTYTGTLVFVLSNNSQNTSGGLASIAGQFGIDIGGGNSGAFEGDNIIELLQSRRIIKGALFKKNADDSTILANIIGENADLFKAWKQKEGLEHSVPFPSDVTKLSPVQDSLVTVMYDFVLKSYLNVFKTDKKLSFYQISVTAPKEIVAVNLTKNTVDEAAKLYIGTKTKTAKENLQMLQREADSIRGKLSGTLYESAATVDETFNLNPALQIQRVPIQKSQIQLQALAAAYAEVLRNLEIAKITLQKETPLYQVIDEPQAPLVKKKTSKKIGILLGGIVAGFLCVCFLFGRKAYRNIMAD